MGRQAYLTHLAWGRSVWSRPESNAWFVRNGQINWDEFIRQRRNAPLPGQHPEHVQEYSSSLHPVNPESRYYGRAMARSANTILSLLGVVVPDGSGSGRQSNSGELELVLPIGLATEAIKELATMWAVNLTERLLVFPPNPDLSFVHVVVNQYRSMGAASFFFAGLPSALVSFPTLPAIVEGYLSYLSYRLVVALVSSAKTRQRCFEFAPFARQVIDFSLTLFQWPFRLHATLQRLGLVPANKLFPEPGSYIPFLGSSPIQFLNTPLPILIFFMYQPARVMLARKILPSFSFYLRPPANATNGQVANQKQKPNPKNGMSGISTFLRKISGFFHGRFSLPVISRWHTTNQGLPLLDSVPTQPNIMEDAEDTAENTTNAVHDLSQLSSGRQSHSQDHSGGPAVVPETVPDATGPNVPEQVPSQGISPSDEDDRDGLSEDQERGVGSDARIRISSMDMASGTINLQVEIGVAEETVEQVVDPNGQHGNAAAPRGVATAVSRKALTVSELAFLPTFTARRWIFRSVASLVLLPASTFVLRGLAAHYVTSGNFGVTPSLVGTYPGRSVLDAGPLLSWSNAQSMGEYASKIGICLLVRYTLETGVLVINSFTISWIGRNYFGWTLP